MGKRAATTPAKTPAKRAATTPAAKQEKVDPVIAEVQSVLTKGLDLPAACAAMLAAVAPSSLGVPREKRDEEQVIVVQWIDATLLKQQARLRLDADAAAEKLRGLEASKAALVGEVEKAEAALKEKKQYLPKKKDALAEATIAATGTKRMLAKAEEQRAGDVAKKKEMESLATVFEDHFKVPLAAGEALHYDKLQPFIGGLDLEESFKVSVSSSCCKTKEQRGPFEEGVLEALEKALIARQVQLRNEVEAGAAEAEKRAKAVRQVEEELAVQKRAQDAAMAELNTAQKEVDAKAVELKMAEEAVAAGEVEFRTATEHAERSKSVLTDFEQGPLQSFRICRDGAASISATAGA